MSSIFSKKALLYLLLYTAYYFLYTKIQTISVTFPAKSREAHVFQANIDTHLPVVERKSVSI